RWEGAGEGRDELPCRAAHRVVLPYRDTRLACGAGAAEPGACERRADRDGRVSAVLVIAGSASSGGAGLARDVRTLARFGTQVMCAVTAVTVQSDSQVTAVHPVAP